MQLDLRTLVLGHLGMSLVCVFVVLVLWRWSPRRFAGTGHWVASFVLLLTALVLLALRDSIPDVLSIVVANTLWIGGAVVLYIGLQHFVGRRSSQVHNGFLVAAFAGIHACFTLLRPDLPIRNLNVSVTLLIISAQCVWLLVWKVDRRRRRDAIGVALVMAGYGLLSIIRIAEFFVGTHASQDFFYPGPFETFVLTSMQVLFLLLTFNLLLMVNRRLLAEVQVQEEKFSKAFRSAPYAMSLSGIPDGRLTDVNEGFVRLTGYSLEEAVGRSTLELGLWADLDDRARAQEELQRNGRLQGRESRFRCRSGALITGLQWAEIIQVEGRSYILSSIEDITRLRQAEEERQRYEATARQQQKLEAIGTLASGVAHEINNPLNVILNYGELLLDDPSDPARVREYAENVVKESERVALIVRNLLSFARRDRESHSPAQLADIVDKTLSLTRSLMIRDRITIVRDIPDDLPDIPCRSQQIQQVLMNLLTNARDALNERYATPSDDKLLRISALLFQGNGGRWVRLTVEDHGGGIPPDIASQVFDPFFTTKGRNSGTGLGLSISYGIMKEHRGELWFRSEPGQGTWFHIDLPVDAVEPGAAGQGP